ncbi:hypothetical protein [Niveibacterium terrae]|uniref:hypothetical protein n=1 Tax=Niveibacterium terrae TaxID=3373598 RepID=UPI003A917A2A
MRVDTVKYPLGNSGLFADYLLEEWKAAKLIKLEGSPVNVDGKGLGFWPWEEDK